MSGTLTWDHAVADIPESGLSTVRRATPDDLQLIVRALGLITCSSLTATYTIMPTGGGHFRVNGRLEASLEQACVASGEPVPARIDVAGQIGVGRVVYECLAGAIHPFPRKADAALERVAASPVGSQDGKPESPFAVLAKIKGKD